MSSICCSSLFKFHHFSTDLLHHLSQIPPTPCMCYSAASLWPCHRTEKRQGIITCHLADNGIPWSLHLFPFKDLCRKTTADAARWMFGCTWQAWAQIYVLDIYHSCRFGGNEVETGVSLFQRFFQRSPAHGCPAVYLAYIRVIAENVLTKTTGAESL